MIRLVLAGNTYGIKDQLKAAGFRWNPSRKAWTITVEDQTEADSMACAYAVDDVRATTEEISDPNERKYFIKESWQFNLESMHDKIWCLIYDIQDHKIELPFTVAGKTINSEGDMYDLMNEVDDLLGAARHKVTGREYGRIREVVAWRVNARYTTCMANGMSEADAGLCFEDM